VLVQHRAGDQLAGVHHQVLGDGVLLGGEGHRLLRPAGRARGAVELHLAGAQEGGGPASRAADEGPEAGAQLVQVEGLDQVVVGPAVEAADALVHPVAGGEDEDRRDLGPPQVGEDRPAAPPGQHEVQQNGVVVPALGLELAGLAVVGDVDGESLLLQRLAHGAGEVDLVFDDQDAHGERAGRGDGGEPPPREWATD